jgi:hypothetical protein
MKLSYFFPGLMNDTKESKKERCWADYKSQQLYIEAMREAKEDPEYDPRRTHLVTGKDGALPNHQQEQDERSEEPAHSAVPLSCLGCTLRHV